MNWRCDFPCDNVEYLVTNESPIYVLGGLEIKLGDNVLAICGSGDIPFAIGGEGANVLAVDIDIEQVIYAKIRKNLLSKGNWEEAGMGRTCHINNIRRDEYFSGVDKGKIFSGVRNLEFKKMDIFSQEFNPQDFNKVYLSNVLPHKIVEEYGEQMLGFDIYVRKIFKSYMDEFSLGFVRGTLIYSSFGFSDDDFENLNLLYEQTSFARKNEKKFYEAIVCEVKK